MNINVNTSLEDFAQMISVLRSSARRAHNICLKLMLEADGQPDNDIYNLTLEAYGAILDAERAAAAAVGVINVDTPVDPPH